MNQYTAAEAKLNRLLKQAEENPEEYAETLYTETVETLQFYLTEDVQQAAKDLLGKIIAFFDKRKGQSQDYLRWKIELLKYRTFWDFYCYYTNRISHNFLINRLMLKNLEDVVELHEVYAEVCARKGEMVAESQADALKALFTVSCFQEVLGKKSAAKKTTKLMIKYLTKNPSLADEMKRIHDELERHGIIQSNKQSK